MKEPGPIGTGLFGVSAVAGEASPPSRTATETDIGKMARQSRDFNVYSP